MWLDAYETKRSAFFVSLQATASSTATMVSDGGEDRAPVVLEGTVGADGVGFAATDGSGVGLTMHEQPRAVQLMGVQLAGAGAARM
jgi:hypothetical protein